MQRISLMSKIKSVCVFLGAKDGKDPYFKNLAHQMGREIAKLGLKLIYGGGDIGLMGEISRTAFDGGSQIKGVHTALLSDREPVNNKLSQYTIRAEDMFERKKILFSKESDAYIVLPGGVGTIDEAMEAITLKDLGIIKSDIPIIFLNCNGYWDGIDNIIKHTIEHGFAKQAATKYYTMVSSVEDVIKQIS